MSPFGEIKYLCRKKLQLSAYTSEFKRNLKIAFPVMFGELGHVLVGLADNIMVGKLGAAELAAVSLGNSLIFIALSFGIGLSLAITPLVAEADGAKATENGRSFFHHGIVLCAIYGLVLFGAIVMVKPLLFQLDQPTEVVRLSLPYIDIVAFSLFPLMVFQAFKKFGDGLSQTKYAMYATIVANLINVLFNYLLIYGIWIFPRLELEGAAIGTLVSRICMLVFLVFILKSKKKFDKYFIWMKKSLRWSVFKRLLHLGFPTGMQMFFETAIFAASVFLAGTLGTKPQAANQIALNLSSMTFMVAVGLGVTATIRVANQKGKQNYQELKRLASSIFLLMFFIEAVFALAFILLNDFLPTLYLNDTEVVILAAQLLLVAALFQLSDGLQVVILGALRGLQDVRVPTLIVFVAYWLIGFPISYFLGKADNFGSVGIWMGLLAGLSVSAGLLYIRFTRLSNKLSGRKQVKRST